MEQDISLPRNPIIAKLFRVARLAENAGYSFNKMINGWKQYTGAPPEFIQEIDFTSVIFRFKNKIEIKSPEETVISDPKGGQKDQKGGQKGGQKDIKGGQKDQKGGQKGDQKDLRGGQKDQEGGQEGGQKDIKGGQKRTLTKRQAEVLNLIRKKPDITLKELADMLHINESAIQKHIDKLKETGAIIRKGGDRGGRWLISAKTS